jgi:hypothetical protein
MPLAPRATAAGWPILSSGYPTTNEAGAAYFAIVSAPTAISLSVFPARNSATTHLGRLPLPDQVSVGSQGFRYLRSTFAYGRRCVFDLKFSASGSPWRQARRRSRSRIS